MFINFFRPTEKPEMIIRKFEEENQQICSDKINKIAKKPLESNKWIQETFPNKKEIHVLQQVNIPEDKEISDDAALDISALEFCLTQNHILNLLVYSLLSISDKPDIDLMNLKLSSKTIKSFFENKRFIKKLVRKANYVFHQKKIKHEVLLREMLSIDGNTLQYAVDNTRLKPAFQLLAAGQNMLLDDVNDQHYFRDALNNKQRYKKIAENILYAPVRCWQNLSPTKKCILIASTAFALYTYFYILSPCDGKYDQDINGLVYNKKFNTFNCVRKFNLEYEEQANSFSKEQQMRGGRFALLFDKTSHSGYGYGEELDLVSSIFHHAKRLFTGENVKLFPEEIIGKSDTHLDIARIKLEQSGVDFMFLLKKYSQDTRVFLTENMWDMVKNEQFPREDISWAKKLG